MPPLRIIRLPELKRKTGLGATTIYEKMAEGKFPKARRLTARAVGWLEHEVDEWLEALKTVEQR